MKYLVELTQVKQISYYSDGTKYDREETIEMCFTAMEDLQTFINLISLNGKDISVSIKFVEEVSDGLEL